MPTTLYFLSSNARAGTGRGNNSTNLAGAAVGWQGYGLTEARGAGALSRVTNSVVGPTSGLEAIISGVVHAEWVSEPLDADVTIAGAIICNIRCFESAAQANAGPQVVVERMDSTGALTTIANSERGTEMGTAEAAANWTIAAGNVTDTACNRGDRIRVRVAFNDAGGTMTSGRTMTFVHGGTGAGLTGDSYLTFAETLTFMTTAPTGTVLYPTATDSGLGLATVDLEMWTSRGAGVTTVTKAGTAGWKAPDQLESGGTDAEWYSKPLQAVTLGGLIRGNIRATRNSNAGNGVRVEVAVCDSNGSNPVVLAAGNLGSNTALSTTEAAHTFDLGVDDRAITDGQRLRLRVYTDDRNDIPDTAATLTTFYYAGTSAAASGDSYLTLPVTVAEVVSGTPVAGSDTGTAADASSPPTVTATATETGAATAETTVGLAALAATDTGAGADSAVVSVGAVTVTASDSGGVAAAAGAFPTTGTIDTFDRANAATLGGNWTVDTMGQSAAGMSIAGNQASNDLADYGEAWWNAAQYGPDCEAFVTVAQLADGTNPEIGLMLMTKTPGSGAVDGYRLMYQAGSDVLSISRVTNGSDPGTLIDSASSIILGAGAKIGLSLTAAGLLTAYIDTGSGWTATLASGTDTTYTGTGYVGLWAYNGSGATNPWKFNDFAGGTTVAATAETAVVTITNAVAAADTGTASSEAATVAQAAADTTAGTDTAQLAAAHPVTDTAAGADTSTVTTSNLVAASDTATGADTATTAALVTAADTAAGSDTVALTYSPTVADTTAGADAATVAVPVAATDTATGADAATATVPVTATDTGTATAETAAVRQAITDSAVAVDLAALAVPVAAADTATGADTGTAAAPVAVTDIATGLDTVAAPAAGLPAADSAAGAEQAVIGVTNFAADTGAGSDLSTLDAGDLKFASDTNAAAVEQAALAVSSPVTDTAAGTDTAVLRIAATDTAAATDAASLTVQHARVDTATGADTATVTTISVTVSDAATGLDQLAARATTATDTGTASSEAGTASTEDARAATDTATGSDTAAVTVTTTAADTATGADAFELVAQAIGADLATGTELANLQAQLVTEEAAASVDTALTLLGFAATDTGHGIDHASRAEVAYATATLAHRRTTITRTRERVLSPEYANEHHTATIQSSEEIETAQALTTRRTTGVATRERTP